jgi:hypothetical protein
MKRIYCIAVKGFITYINKANCDNNHEYLEKPPNTAYIIWLSVPVNMQGKYANKIRNKRRLNIERANASCESVYCNNI